MKYFLLLSVLLLGLVCFADGSTTTTLANLDAPTPADLQLFTSNIASAKTLGIMGLIVLLVQGFMFAIKLKFADLGKWNLAIVTSLSTILGVLVLKNNGLTWLEALASSQTLWAVQVAIHQWGVQFGPEKSSDPVLPVGNKPA